MRVAASLILLGCVALLGCRDGRWPGGRYPRVDADDSSVLLEEPYRTTTGAFNQNGTAFDRAEVGLGGAGVVWLPEPADWSEVEVIVGGEAGRVVVELEKRLFDYSHTDKGADIRQDRRRVQVRVARPSGAVVVAGGRGWGHKECAMHVVARFRVPAGVRVERGQPATAGAAPFAWEAAPQTPVPVPEARR